MDIIIHCNFHIVSLFLSLLLYKSTHEYFFILFFAQLFASLCGGFYRVDE